MDLVRLLRNSVGRVKIIPDQRLQQAQKSLDLVSSGRNGNSTVCSITFPYGTVDRAPNRRTRMIHRNTLCQVDLPSRYVLQRSARWESPTSVFESRSTLVALRIPMDLIVYVHMDENAYSQHSLSVPLGTIEMRSITCLQQRWCTDTWFALRENTLESTTPLLQELQRLRGILQGGKDPSHGLCCPDGPMARPWAADLRMSKVDQDPGGGWLMDVSGHSLVQLVHLRALPHVDMLVVVVDVPLQPTLPSKAVRYQGAEARSRARVPFTACTTHDGGPAAAGGAGRVHDDTLGGRG